MRCLCLSGEDNPQVSDVAKELALCLESMGVRVVRVLPQGGGWRIQDQSGTPALYVTDNLTLPQSVACSLTITDILARCFFDRDFVFFEGFPETLMLPKIWVETEVLRSERPSGVLAVYTACGKPYSHQNSFSEIETLAEYLIKKFADVEKQRAHVYIDGKRLPLKNFIAEFIHNSVRGMLASLKGGSSEKSSVSIFLPLKKKD